MAGDWIKVRTSLPKDGRLRIAAKALKTGNALGNASANAYSVTCFGALVTLWCFADEQADEDGKIVGYDFEDINDLVGIPGFCESLPNDWIQIEDGWVKLPEYEQHNGKNAKKRAQTARRVANAKANAKINKRVTQEVTHPALPDALPREEKRREDIYNPPKGPPLKNSEIEKPPGLNAKAWTEYIDYRREQKLRKLKATSEKKQMAWLIEQGDESHQAAIVEQTIRNNYQGLFDLKVSGNGTGGKIHRETATERAAWQAEHDAKVFRRRMG